MKCERVALMLSANSSRALAPIVSIEVMSVGSLFLVLAAVPCRQSDKLSSERGIKERFKHPAAALLQKTQRERRDEDLQRRVELGLVHLQVSEDGKDGEDGRVVVAQYGSASGGHDVVSLQHQVVQRLLWTDEGTGSRLNAEEARAWMET